MLLGSYFFDSLPVDVLRVRRRPEAEHGGVGASGEGASGEGASGEAEAEASTVEALAAVEAVVPRLSCAARGEAAGGAEEAEAEVFAYVPCDPATYYEPASDKPRSTAPGTAPASASAPAPGPALGRLLTSCLAEASVVAVPTLHVPTAVPTGAARCLWRLAALRRAATARCGVVPMMLLVCDKVGGAELTPHANPDLNPDPYPYP